MKNSTWRHSLIMPHLAIGTILLLLSVRMTAQTYTMGPESFMSWEDFVAEYIDNADEADMEAAEGSLLTRQLEDNSIEDVPVELVHDTAMLRRWYIRASWVPGGQYTLTIPDSVFRDVAGYANDSIVGKYTVYDPEKFATVKVHVSSRNPESKYIIQLLDGNGSLKQERRDVMAGDVQFNYVPAGEIQFRVIEDRNGNGKWDSGNLVARLQPERAEMYANAEGESTFATKTNWEIEFTMDMDRLFAPVTMQSLSRLLDERETQRLRREAEKRTKEGPKQRQDNQQNMNSSFGSAGSMFSNFR